MTASQTTPKGSELASVISAFKISIKIVISSNPIGKEWDLVALSTEAYGHDGAL